MGFSNGFYINSGVGGGGGTGGDVYWSSIIGKPLSTPQDIDRAVAEMHTHTNKAVLDKLGDDSGTLIYDGNPIGGAEQVAEDLKAHEEVIASTNVLGHVKIDGTTLSIDSNGVLSVIGGNTGDGSIEYFQSILPTTTIGQNSWTIPLSGYNPNKDLTIVVHNTTLLFPDMYNIIMDENSYVINVTTDIPSEIDKNSLMVIIITGASSGGTVTDIDGSIIIDGTITMEKLSQNLQDKINNAQVDSISADKVVTNPNKEFISSVKKGQIDSNTSTLSSYGGRITNIENQLAQGIQSDGKVKMDENSVPVYLEEILDGTTIINDNGVLKVITLEGMNTTANEIDNLLHGATSNIQSQIDALNSIGNYTTSVETYADLANITSPQEKDMVIVISDETQDGATTIYIYNGTSWTFSGFFKGGEVRDFTVNPINLANETTGILQKNKYEKQNAKETPITSSNFVSTNVEEAMNELFTYANNIKVKVASGIGYPLLSSDDADTLYTKIINLKTLLADAITTKGIISFPYNTLEEMANQILTIPSITMEGVIKKKTKINVVAGSTIDVVLQDAMSIGDITATLIEFIGGAQNVVHYNLDFNNGDKSNFEPNPKLKFDGVMKLNDEVVLDMDKDISWTDNGYLYTREITRDEWMRIDKIEVKQNE